MDLSNRDLLLVHLVIVVFIAQYHELAAEASYLMAMVYDKLGRVEEREEAAALFKKHIIALENPQDVEQNMA